MIHEFQARGETPVIWSNSVWFGPHLVVYVDDSLPDDTFRIALK
jgi:hypothetical protein